MNELDLSAKGFVRQPDGSWGKPSSHRVAPGSIDQPSDVHEPVAKDAGEVDHQGRRLVRITLFRRRILDDDNPYPKHFVDALKEAGILVDDSPRWCKIEIFQRLVDFHDQEHTQIDIERLP